MTQQQFITVMTPAFVSEFQCIGGDCQDNCCHAWDIDVDKKTFKNLKKNNNVIIKQLANDHLKLTRTSDQHWGKIELADNGCCPFLDNNGWCEIHKQCGHNALSKTCQEYPKAWLFFGNQVEKSISLSCPTAAEKVLLNPSAFMFKKSEQSISEMAKHTLAGHNQAALPLWMPILRDCAFSIVMFDQIPFDVRIFVLGMVFKQAENFLGNPARLEEFIKTAEEMVVDGSFSKMYASLPKNNKLKWLMFANQHHKLDQETELYVQERNSEQITANQQRFEQCRTPIFGLIEQRKENKPDAKDIDLFSEILEEGSTIVAQYFDEKPHVLVNYILYYLYHNQFMAAHNKSPFEFFKILSVDLFMLRTYLAGIALTENGLSDDKLIQLFQTYARRRQHGQFFVSNMEIQLKESKTDGPGAIFSLLK
jgi:lysine-N-methylase